MINEFRFALRRLTRHPFHLAAGLLAFALGIGVNTAMFSVAQAIMFKPLDLPHLDQLVVLQSFHRGTDRGIYDISPADFKDFASQSRAFTHLAFTETYTASLTRDKDPEQLTAASVSTNWLDTLETPLLLGRTFRPGESTPGNHRVVILGEGVWKRRFGADPAIIGRRIQINRTDFEVIGVVRDTGRFPAFAQLFTPLAITPEVESRRAAFDYLVIGRLAPGRSLASAQSEINAIQSRISDRFPASHAGRTVDVVPLYARVAGTNDLGDRYIRMLLYATAFALLIACANVANLQLARVSGRSREFAIQASLGAGRWAIARQVLIESVLLSGGGAILGATASVWTVESVKRLLPAELWQYVPMWPYLQVDFVAVGYTSLLAIAAGIVAGLAPAFSSLRNQAQDALREGGRSSSRGPARQWTRTLLVSSQMALALLLLIGAGLMIRSASASLHRFDGRQPGFIATSQMELQETFYSSRDKRIAFTNRLSTELSRIPGLTEVALVNQIPLSDNNFRIGFSVEGRPQPTIADRPRAYDFVASPGYFPLMRIPLISGRYLTAEDNAGREPVCVVDQTLASRTFPDQNPLGQRLQIHYRTGIEPCRIVGVVTPEIVDAWDRSPSPVIYRSIYQTGSYNLAVLARGSGSLSALLAAMQKAVAAVDPELPVNRAMSFLDIIAITVSGLNLVAVLMSAIGIVALILACLGIYGVMSYVVSERIGEIGMRVALGASPLDIAALLAGQGFRMCAWGMAVGLTLGFFAARALSGLIFGISPNDFYSLASVSLLLAAVAALAIYLPARRAIRMDPATALRHD